MLFLFIFIGVAQATDYFGIHLGNLRNASYALDGDVYLVNRSHIQIVDFNVKRMINREQLEFQFFGEGEKSAAAAGLYEYKELDKRNWLQVNGKELRDGATNRRLIVAIPGDLHQWQKFGIVDMERQSSISTVPLNKPAPEPFCCIRNEENSRYAIEGEYGARVDPIEVLDAKTLRLPNFNFYGTKPPDGWIFAGRGNDILQTTGKKALILGRDTGHHHCAMHEDYQNYEMTVRLSGSQTVYDIDWISVFCYQYEHDFGHVKVHMDRFEQPVPAYLPSLRDGPPPKRKHKQC